MISCVASCPFPASTTTSSRAAERIACRIALARSSMRRAFAASLHAGGDLIDDRMRIFAARVVARDDDLIRETLRRFRPSADAWSRRGRRRSRTCRRARRRAPARSGAARRAFCRAHRACARSRSRRAARRSASRPPRRSMRPLTDSSFSMRAMAASNGTPTSSSTPSTESRLLTLNVPSVPTSTSASPQSDDKMKRGARCGRANSASRAASRRRSARHRRAFRRRRQSCAPCRAAIRSDAGPPHRRD